MKPASVLVWLSVAACSGNERPIPNVPRSMCPSPQLREHAVCTCGDVAHVGKLAVREGPGGVGSIGTNGAVSLVSDAEVAGTWIAWGGFDATGAAIGDSLVTPHSVDVVGDLTVGGDAVIGGDLDTVGTLAIRGALALGGDASLVGDVTIARRTPYVAPAEPPCGCNDQRFFDVAGAVSLARERLGPSGTPLGDGEIHLATGSYYVPASDLVGDRHVVIDGAVSLFVDGSLATVGTDRWTITDGARLDMFVAGDVAAVGNLTAGDRAHPDAFALYLGGDGDASLDVVGDAEFYGSLYAPRADVAYVGDMTIVGSIFAYELDGVGTLTVEYGKPLVPPSSCLVDDVAIGAPRGHAAQDSP